MLEICINWELKKTWKYNKIGQIRSGNWENKEESWEASKGTILTTTKNVRGRRKCKERKNETVKQRNKETNKRKHNLERTQRKSLIDRKRYRRKRNIITKQSEKQKNIEKNWRRDKRDTRSKQKILLDDIKRLKENKRRKEINQ